MKQTTHPDVCAMPRCGRAVDVDSGVVMTITVNDQSGASEERLVFHRDECFPKWADLRLLQTFRSTLEHMTHAELEHSRRRPHHR